MNTATGLLRVSAVAAAMSFSAPALSETDFDLRAAAGVRYDSNINVEEADIDVGAEDIAAVFDLAASYEIEAGPGTLEVGYDFGQRLYDEFDQFDLQSHRLSAGAQTRISGARLGVDYSYTMMRLGGDPFLNMHLVSPSAAGFVAPKTYARGYYRYLSKRFDTSDERDAERHSGGVKVYRFFMQNDAFVSLGARYDAEDAVGPEYDFKGFLLDASIQLPLPGVDEGEIQFGYDYRERDYDSVTPSIGEARTENRSRFEAAVEVPLVRGLALETEYQYTDRNSNLPSADYNEHLITGALVYRFF